MCALVPALLAPLVAEITRAVAALDAARAAPLLTHLLPALPLRLWCAYEPGAGGLQLLATLLAGCALPPPEVRVRVRVRFRVRVRVRYKCKRSDKL